MVIPHPMVIPTKTNVTHIISLRFPAVWYPGTSPLHSLIEEKEWNLVAWRLFGVDWDEIRTLSSHDPSATDPSAFGHFFKRITCGDGFSVFPNISSYCILPIPEVLFARSVDCKLPIHVAIDADAPLETLNMLLGKDGFLLHSSSDVHGLPLYYACHSLTSQIPLGQRVVVIDFLLRSFPHAAFIKSPKGDYPLHALMKNRPSLELVELFLSIERDGSGKTVPVLGGLLDDDGQVPLHIGLEFDAPEESIRALLEFNPHVVGHRRDMDGKSPVDLANPSIIGDDVIASLLVPLGSSCANITYR
jgi:ankyrin repeat protein